MESAVGSTTTVRQFILRIFFVVQLIAFEFTMKLIRCIAHGR